MLLHPSKTQRALQQKVRRFVYDELIPLEVETELAEGRLADATRIRLHARVKLLQLNAFSLPQALGGREFNWVDQTIVNEEMGKATNALGWVMWDPAIVLAYATEEQVERYVRPSCEGTRGDCYAITEPAHGSDASAMDTTATRDGDDWILNGEKWHLTSGDVADYAVVQTATDANIGDGNTLFFMDLDSPGIEIIDYPKYMHNLIVEHPRVRLNNVRVPDANVLGGVGRGLELSKEWFRHERVMIAARCCGAAARLIEEATEFAKTRMQFGQPIANYQAIQFMLADSLMEQWAARLMTYETAHAADEAKTPEQVKRVHAKSSMVKLFASEMAGRVADRTVQIFGGRGYMREFAAERFFRELRVERIWEGTSEIQRIIIANSLFKRGVAAHLEHSFSPEECALRERVRKFTREELVPLELETEMANGKLAPEKARRVHDQMIELNLNGMCIPRELGGRGYSYVEQTIIEEELGQVTNGIWDLIYSPAVCLTAANADQIERFVRPTCEGKRRDAYAITEAGAGSDPSAIETTAVRDGDEWVINGDKWHVTSGEIADYLVVQAQTQGGSALFFVDKDTPGVNVYAAPRYMHTFVVEHLKIRFENVRVPHVNLLGEIGGGLALTKEWFRRERLMIAARCCGAAARLIDEATEFAKTREQFGQPISEYQAVQFMLADSLTELWAARLMTYAAAQAADEARTDDERKIVHARVSMAKLYASEMANRVADRAVQIFGGRGYMRENAAERYYRELRVDRIWEGTSEIQRLIIGGSLLKRGVQEHIGD